MKSLATETKALTAEQCAALVMERIPQLMHAIRHLMRQHRPADLALPPDFSLPQFRTLGVLQRHPGATLSLAAAHLNLTLASMSKIIDTLVRQDLVTREHSPNDRRKVVLNLTDTGRRTLQAIRDDARGRLAKRLEEMRLDERQALVTGLQALANIFLDEGQREG